MKTTEKIYDQHAENSEMMQKLFFYKDEIGIMQKRIEEVAGKNSSNEVLAKIEHFQNQLIVQRNNIDILKHKVSKNEQALVDNLKANPVAADHREVQVHAIERDEVLAFEKVFNELRNELNKFLFEWL
ncbi:MAG: hypothetical protein ACXVC6_15510 [Bacteroidia bacterium]